MLKIPFSEQIEGVPRKLVEQGWRIKCQHPYALDLHEARHKWEKQPNCYWRDIPVDERCLKWWTCPIRLVPEDRGRLDSHMVYDHSGWGDGLAPTIEMVKVWEYWWFGPHPVRIVFERGAFWYFHPLHGAWVECMNYSNGWRGPVLPPAGSL